MFFLPGRKIAVVIKMEALIIRERDQLEKFGSAWAVARHTIICRHTLHKTSSCEHCEPHMLTVLILHCELLAEKQITPYRLQNFQNISLAPKTEIVLLFSVILAVKFCKVV